MTPSVRVRFAPSPTGPLHMGGVRTALFNYLFAKKHQGTFILRIEDTDQTRFVPGAEDYIIESLAWCGIQFDEGIREGGNYGPYRQSDRKALYEQYAQELIETGKAYYAFDTPEELDQLRKDAEQKGETFTYDAKSRLSLKNSLAFTPEETRQRIEQGDAFVIRFRMPEQEEVVMEDLIRGTVKVNTASLDDKILFKSDGMPTYHLANIVDDHLMAISHVIRGEEWLPSLPLHQLLYEAFGWEKPAFAHLPLILKPTGKGKLSKRDGDKMGFPVFPTEWTDPSGEVYSGYRESGYLPEAFINLLALLGWNPGTEQELFSLDELIESFSLERVGKSGSRFDPDKAKWFNHQWMQVHKPEELAEQFRELLKAKGHSASSEQALYLVNLLRERVNFLSELWNESYFFFEAPAEYDEKVVKKKWNSDVALWVEDVLEVIKNQASFESTELEEKIKAYIHEKQMNPGGVLNALRLCLVGASKGPHLFDIMSFLGKEGTCARLERALQQLPR